MTNIRTPGLLLLALAVATADNALPAQDVVLSEIGRDQAGTWIELWNRGTTPVDLGTWSLYLATATPGRPQTYWWGFPAGTTVAGNGFLIVRWLQPVPATPVPGEIATGSTQYGFLFSLGAEDPPLARGAMALLRSQDNALMNSPAIFADWVSWGQAGLQREALAEQAGIWLQGHATPARTDATSLAHHPTASAPSQPETTWFLDGTPTPGQSNVGAAAVQVLGDACAPAGHRLLGAPQLLAQSAPVIGNAAFALRVTNTTGVFLERCLFVFTTATAPAGIGDLLPTVAGSAPCLVWIDPSSSFGEQVVRTTITATTLPMSLANVPLGLAGATFGVQALVFDAAATTWPPYQGLTNALAITLGS